MSDITIQSLAQADQQRPRDVIAIQRRVAGVPTDFQTDFSTLSGGVELAFLEIDLSANTIETIVTPGAGQIALLLACTLLYIPSDPQTDPPASASFQIISGAQPVASSQIRFGASGGGGMFHTTGYSNELDQPMTVELSTNPAYTGTAKLIVQYVLLTL